MPDNTGQKQDTQFRPGQSGNPKGRPKGARNKLGESFIADLQADWEANGPEVIKAVRQDNPAAYLRVIASVLPKDLNVAADFQPRDTLKEFLDDISEFGSRITDGPPETARKNELWNERRRQRANGNYPPQYPGSS